MTFEVAGRVTLDFRSVSSRVERYLCAQMEPYEPLERTLGRRPDIVLAADLDLEFDDLVEVQRPAGDGIVTATDGNRLYLLADGHACSVPATWQERPLMFSYEAGFPVWKIFSSAVRPAIQVALLDYGACAVHSAAVERDGEAIMIAGWSESGKTEAAIAFVEKGWHFISDKWTVLTRGGAIAPFPIRVGVRRWVLRYSPQLRRSLPPAARTQLMVAGIVARLARPTRRLVSSPSVGPIVEGFTTALELGERASLRPSRIGVANDRKVALSANLTRLVLLTTVTTSRVRAAPADPERAARRLVTSASYERRRLFDLGERARFALPATTIDLKQLIERREEKLLSEALASVPIVEVQAPFPCDPRRIVEVVSGLL